MAYLVQLSANFRLPRRNIQKPQRGLEKEARERQTKTKTGGNAEHFLPSKDKGL